MPKGYLSLLMFVHCIPKLGHFVIPTLEPNRFFICFPGTDRSKQNLFAQGAHCKILIKCFGNTSSLLMFPVILGQFILCNIKPICSCFFQALWYFPRILPTAHQMSRTPLHVQSVDDSLTVSFTPPASPVVAKGRVSCRIWRRTRRTKTLPASLTNVYQHSLRLRLVIISYKKSWCFAADWRGKVVCAEAAVSVFVKRKTPKGGWTSPTPVTCHLESVIMNRTH